MFSEILKVIPKLDQPALNTMQNSLSKRFTSIAKKFGSGLKAAITGGGVTALAFGLIDKLLNPLKETQDAIERLLNKADDINTFSKQFNSTPDKLFRIQTLAEAKGIAPEQLNILIEKFQNAVVQAKTNPDQPSPVQNFLNEKDQVEGFFKFIQGLQKLTPDQQTFVQTQVFGEKQILKMAEFLQADFEKLKFDVGLANDIDYGKPILRGAEISDRTKILKAQTNVAAFPAQLNAIQPNVADFNNLQDQVALGQETKNISRFDLLKNQQIQMQRLTNKLEDAFAQLLKYTPQITEALVNISRSRFIKGLAGGSGNEK